MNVKLLVDAIVRQTTVLIAQLATSAGVRAPLANVADQVFLSLAKEIEAQGVGKKVVADMFGMALRSYQRKTQRLAASSSEQGKTLFEAVLEFIERRGGASREQVLTRFARDGERETIGVLTDLVHSGLLYCTGGEAEVLYGVTSDAERQRLTRTVDEAAMADMAWGAIYRGTGITLTELASQLGADESKLREAVERLKRDGRATEVTEEGTAVLRSATFQIPLGAGHGWESALFDHYQALASAIVTKLSHRGSEVDRAGWLGGSTLRFELHAQHPHKAQVLGLLANIRAQTAALWDLVSDYNDAHPMQDAERVNVCFYFGQSIDDPDRIVAAPQECANEGST